MLDHLQDGPATREGPGDVDADGVLSLLGGDFGEWPGRAAHAAVVDQDVDPPGALQHGADGSIEKHSSSVIWLGRDTTVVGNKVKGRFNGIRLTGAITSAYIAGNAVSLSTNNGIAVEGGSGNLINRNQVSSSGLHDCFDPTHGAATAGTANYWRRNTGSSANSSPPAICP